MNQCSYCHASLSQATGFVFCTKCNTPHFFGKTNSPFDIFNLERNFQLSLKDLEQAYYDLSHKLHPDRFTTASKELQLKSQELSSLLNRSFTALRDPETRLEVLLTEVGVWNPEDQSTEQKQIPTDLTEKFFELQEDLAENPKKATLDAQDFKKRLMIQDENLTHEIYELAKKINWKHPSKEWLEKILEFRKKCSYIRSIINNLNRLLNHA